LTRALTAFVVPAAIILVTVPLAGCRDGFTVPAAGTITIEAYPAGLPAPWTLTGPDGFTATGVGDAELRRLAAGRYAIAWTAVGAWSAPAGDVRILHENGVASFHGVYVLATPDQALVAFRLAYAERDLRAYDWSLSENFTFVPQGEEPDRKDAEIAIVRRMFAGKPGYGGAIIGGIDVAFLASQAPWGQPGAHEPHFGGYPDSRCRTYDVDLRFHLANQDLTYHVQGPVKVYVVDEAQGGTSSFRILGLVDETYGDDELKPCSWTIVRDLFE